MHKHVEFLKEYIGHRSLPSWERNGELITHCLLNNCDDDSKDTEAHFYISLATGQWNCKKCSESGNVITLAKSLKEKGDLFLSDKIGKKEISNPRFLTQVETAHKNLPERIRRYLREKRGLTDEVIDRYKIGWFYLNGTNWITFPIKDQEGKYRFFKLRQDPDVGDQKFMYPAGNEAQIYDFESLNSKADRIVIAEGESDRLLLESKGIPAITTTAGAGTFKDEWLPLFPKHKTYYVTYDNDSAGKAGAEKAAGKLWQYGIENVYLVSLPERKAVAGKEIKKVDITDFFMELGGVAEDLFVKYAQKYPLKIDSSGFKEISIGDLERILSLTIKEDNANKVATFCAQLTAYTDDSQFNVSFNGPSSGGKSHTAIEVSHFYPLMDVIKLASASPTAFFHEQGIYDKERNVITVDLSRKILIFLDMPHNMLLERLRPLLSHDEKIMQVKITDKNQKGGNKTKTVEIIGFPSVIFCTAGLNIDEQEATRFLLLSPEMTESKIKQGIKQAIRKGSDGEEYKKWLLGDEERQLLINRIRAIKNEKISDIKIENQQAIEDRFLNGKKHLKPKHQRDVKRIMSLIKAFTLLNLFFRKRSASVITASESDVENGFKIWEAISTSQELGIPPYIYNLFHEVILAKFNEKNGVSDGKYYSNISYLGLSRKEIRHKHFEVYGRQVNDYSLREQIIPMLETAGLIEQEDDPNDKRFKLTSPILEYQPVKTENSAEVGGVNTTTDTEKVDADAEMAFADL